MAFNFGGSSDAPKFGESPGSSNGFSFGTNSPVSFDSPSTSNPIPSSGLSNLQSTPSSGFGASASNNASFGAATSGNGGFGGGFGASEGEVKPMFGQSSTPAAAENPEPTNGSSAKKSPGTKGNDDDGNVDDSQLILPELKGGAFSATVTTTTGEEQEEAIFSERSKMYIFYKEDKYGDEVRTNMWKERGKGQLKILKHKVTGKYRILMRQEATKKIICNAPITGNESLTYPSAKQVTMTVQDFDAETAAFMQKTVAFKVRGPPEMEGFKTAFAGASGGKVTEVAMQGYTQPAATTEGKQAAVTTAPTSSPAKISFGGGGGGGGDTGGFTMGATAASASPGANAFSNLSMTASSTTNAPAFGSTSFGSGGGNPSFGSAAPASTNSSFGNPSSFATPAFGANTVSNVAETKTSTSSPSGFCDVTSLESNQSLNTISSRKTQLIYKNVCARYRSLHNGANPTTVVQCPGTCFLLGNRATFRHGMGCVTSSAGGRGVVLCCGDKLSNGAGDVDHVQDHAVSFDNNSEWSLAVNNGVDPKLGARHVVFQTDLPTSSPLSLGHSEAMSVAMALAQKVTSLGSEYATVAGVSKDLSVYTQGEYGRMMPTASSSNGSTLVIAVGPTPRECGLTYSSNGDLELQCVALILANKYQYKDVMDMETPTMNGLFDADFAKCNVKKPASEWVQFVEMLLDQEDYSVDEILSLISNGGEESTIPSLNTLKANQPNLRLKLKQHAKVAFNDMDSAATWMSGDKTSNEMKIMMSHLAAKKNNLVDKKAKKIFKAGKAAGLMCRVLSPANIDTNYIFVGLCSDDKVQNAISTLQNVDGVTDVWSKISRSQIVDEREILLAGYVNVNECVVNDVNMEELLQDLV